MRYILFFFSVQNIFSKFEMATYSEVSSIISLTTGKVAKMILDKIFFGIKICFFGIYQTNHISINFNKKITIIFNNIYNTSSSSSSSTIKQTLSIHSFFNTIVGLYNFNLNSLIQFIRKSSILTPFFLFVSICLSILSIDLV